MSRGPAAAVRLLVLLVSVGLAAMFPGAGAAEGAPLPRAWGMFRRAVREGSAGAPRGPCAGSGGGGTGTARHWSLGGFVCGRRVEICPSVLGSLSAGSGLWLGTGFLPLEGR